MERMLSHPELPGCDASQILRGGNLHWQRRHGCRCAEVSRVETSVLAQYILSRLAHVPTSQALIPTSTAELVRMYMGSVNPVPVCVCDIQIASDILILETAFLVITRSGRMKIIHLFQTERLCCVSRQRPGG